MLTAMETEVPAAGPWIVLALAVLALLGLGVDALRGRRAAAPPPPPWRDDLPAFFSAPPSTVRRGGSPPPVPLSGPGAAAPLAAPVVHRPADPVVPGAAAGPRLLPALAGVALVLVAAAAVVALLARDPSVPRAPSPSSPAPAAPALPLPAAAPAPGETGAGGLAVTSLPLGPDGEAARLTFGGVVLERYAAGVRAAYPAVSLTVRDRRALVHVRFPTANCFATAAPPDAAGAGCVTAPTEYADLPTPALTVRGAGRRLTVQGRFATYVRPDGAPPTYTGRVYDLTITVVTGRPDRNGDVAASGTLTLGTDTTATVGDRSVDVAHFGR